MAVDQAEVLTFDIYDLKNISFVGSYQGSLEQGGDQNPVQVLFGSVAVISEPASGTKRYISYVTANEYGLQIFQADGKAVINQQGMYESVGEANLRQVIRSIPAITVGLMTGHPEIVQVKVWVRLAYILFGTFLFFGLAGLWLFLFSQFVLPIQTVPESIKAVRRLVSSLMGEHGPVVYVKEGKIIHRPDELSRPGPGVARVDLNSAIVLEKRSLMNPQYRQQYNREASRQIRKGKKLQHARVEGPGVVFIEPYESIHGVADLRPQFRMRPGVRAYTRDGIEIENPVWILFTLGQPPEILDVTYEGKRIPENLRVINFEKTDIPARESIQQLETESPEFYSKYQIIRRFFHKAKELASGINTEDLDISDQDSDQDIQQYITVIHQFAMDWEIADTGQVREFTRDLENQIATLDLTSKEDRELFVENIELLADQLLRDVMIDFYENIYQGRKQSGLVVKQLSPELDPEDQKEIHRFVQTQTVSRYFLNVKSLASNIDCDNPNHEDIRGFNVNISQLAIRWGIQYREEIRAFLDCVGALILELDLTIPSEVQWVVFQICMLADEYSLPRMVDYYEDIYPELVENYQLGLRDLMSTRGLSRFARQAMADLSNTPIDDDGIRFFCLNAIDLWRNIRPEFETILVDLESDIENQVEIELLQTALMKFDRISQSLIRTDYPFTDSYSALAELRRHFSELQKIAPQINLRTEFRNIEYLKLFPIRRTVRNIQQELLELENIGESEFKRYLDLILIFDYVKYVRGCVQEYRRIYSEEQKTSKHLHKCVLNIKQRSSVLDQISGKSFQRPVKRIKNWVNALSDNEPAYLNYFARQVGDLWKKIEAADKLAVQKVLRNGKKQVDQIQRDIRQFTIQSKSLDDSGEIRRYKKSLDQIQAILENCKFPQSILYPGSESGENVRFGPFVFVRKRVLAAIYSKALEIDQEGEYMPWTNLPVHATAQTFRNLVAKEQYDYLFEPKDAHKFNIPKLKANLSAKMRNQGVLAYRFVDQVDGKSLAIGKEWSEDELIFYEPKELENPKVLRARGVKVIAAGFPDLFPVSSSVPRHLLDAWRAPWESKATDIRGQHQLQAVRVINQARAQAQQEMAHSLARIMQSSRSEEALAMRVFQALEATAVDSDTRQFLPRDTMYLLRSFKQWFLSGEDDRMGQIDEFDRPDDDQPLLDM
jgi:hypothetical protein